MSAELGGAQGAPFTSTVGRWTWIGGDVFPRFQASQPDWVPSAGIYIYIPCWKKHGPRPRESKTYMIDLLLCFQPLIEQFVLRDSDNGSPMVGQEDLAQQFNIPSSWLVKRPPKGLCLDEEIHLQEHL